MKYQKTLIAAFISLAIQPNYAEHNKLEILGNTKSWESNEYLNDWGLSSMNASTAYALGFNGKDINVGIVDSGVLFTHSEFANTPIKAILSQGKYYTNGVRYPDSENNNFGEYKQGESFNIDGNWHQKINDGHGTHVGGTIAAARDGKEMHGVAWNANLFSANTGGNDSMTYGPHQDYNYFLSTYSALADAGVKAVNNSWGSNRKIHSAFSGATGYYWDRNTKTIEEIPSDSEDPYYSLYIKNLDVAYKAYYQFLDTKQKSWLDAAYEVATDRQIVQVFTSGNRREMPEPYTRAMLPYFKPDAEPYWVAVTGQDKDDNQQYNLVGHSKYWGIAAPAIGIYSSRVENDGTATYKYSNGTSMAAPHITGALAVIMQRYPYMSSSQARDVMLTTARRTNLNGEQLNNWTAPHNTPDIRWGWGIVDLGKAMFGPSQFIGKFTVSMTNDDIWSNDISDEAIKYREIEDNEEAVKWNQRKAELSQKIKSTEEAYEFNIGIDRENARQKRLNDGYTGSLVKLGKGVLTLSGNNSFKGETIIKEGKIIALNQSLHNSKMVIVENGAELEIINNIDIKNPSEIGYKISKIDSDGNVVNATIKDGGIFSLNNEVKGVNLEFEKGSLLNLPQLSDETVIDIIRNNKTTTYKGYGVFNGINNIALKINYAFISANNLSDENQLQVKLAAKPMDSLAFSDTTKTIAREIELQPNLSLYKKLALSTEEQAKHFYNHIAYDADLALQNQQILNMLELNRNIYNGNNYSNIKKENINENIHLWTNAKVNRASTKDIYEANNLASRRYTQLIGIDFPISNSIRTGIFSGLSKQDTSLDHYKTKQKDFHLGIYNQFIFNRLEAKFGVNYTESKYQQQIKLSNKNNNTMQGINVSGEMSYRLPYIEPFTSINYLYNKVDEIRNNNFQIEKNSRNITAWTIGLRPNIEFELGYLPMTLSGEIAYNQFWGDKISNAKLLLNDEYLIKLTGKEIKPILSAGINLSTKLNNIQLKLGYEGYYNKQIKSHQLNAGMTLLF